MVNIAFDCETYPIYQCGKSTKDQIPRMVCMSYHGERGKGVLERERAVPLFLEWLADPDVHLIGHNLVFDLAVMVRACAEEGHDILAQVFQGYEKRRFWDTGIRARMKDIAQGGLFIRGGYTLNAMTKRYIDVDRSDQKKGVNVWRLRYNELEGKRAEDYPQDAWDYAYEDALYTYELFLRQTPHPTEQFQCQADWALHLMSSWGVMLDPAWAESIDDYYAQELDKYRRLLMDPENGVDGQPVIRPDGTMDTKVKKAIFEEAFASIGEPPIVTDKGATKTCSKTIQYLEDRGVEEGRFGMLLKYNRAGKFRSTYLEPILDAQEGPLCARFNVLVDTGRTSSSKPNVQNFPARTNAEEKMRMELLFGSSDPEEPDAIRIALGGVRGADIRGCFVPRDGHRFVAADYSALEMCTLAQVLRNLLGHETNLGKAINQGMDLHSYVAAVMLGVTYEDLVALVESGDLSAKEARQVCKIANFGFAGGASAKTFMDFARGFGTILTLSEAEHIREVWYKAWPEMHTYFRHISDIQTTAGWFYVEQHGPNRATRGWRLRKTKKYTAAANSYFQGLAADGAKYALWKVTKEQFDPSSPLYGSRLVLFIHDELVIEAPEETAEAAGVRLGEIMVECMRVFTPDINIEAKPEVLEGRWTK